MEEAAGLCKELLINLNSAPFRHLSTCKNACSVNIKNLSSDSKYCVPTTHVVQKKAVVKAKR